MIAVWLPIITAVLGFIAKIAIGLQWSNATTGIAKQLIGEPGVAVTRLSEELKNTATDSVQNTISAATGGALPPAQSKPIPGAYVPEVTSTDKAISAFTNPWLYVGVAAAAFGFTTLTRQTRGLARDVGSGAKSTKKAFDALGADP